MYRIKEKYAKINVDENYTIITSERDSVVLQSALAIQLLETIAASKVTKEKIITGYQNYSPNLSEVLITLHQLESEGYITQDPIVFPKEQSAYWEELGYDVTQLAKVFEEKTIAVKALGDCNADHFFEACQHTGIQISDDPSLTVVITSSYLHPDLEQINKEMLAQNKTWLLLKLQGTTPYIGPLMRPNEKDAACWKCLQHRFLLHDQENKLYQALAKTDDTITRPIVYHPLAVSWAIQIAVLELVSWLYHGKNETIYNQLIALDSKTGERTQHTVVKRPQCIHCGDEKGVLKHPLPIQLQAQKSVDDVPGGYRTVAPEDTLEKYKHHVSPITGIVPYLKEYHPVKGVPIFNYVSGKNMALQRLLTT